jgi:GNAT superfamily N-acetyltransferase
MTAPSLHRATLGHARGLARVYVDAWRATYAGLLPARALTGMSYDKQTADWAYQIRHKGLHCPILVALDARGAVVGLTSFGRARIEDRPAAAPFLKSTGGLGPGEVFTLYVHPDSQDAGIGRLLLDGAFAGLRERGMSQAFVWVLHDNPARYFYERLGGSYVADREEELWGVRVRQVAYGWPDLAVNALVRTQRFG